MLRLSHLANALNINIIMTKQSYKNKTVSLLYNQTLIDFEKGFYSTPQMLEKNTFNYI